jgi:hypothetical protein
VRTSSFVLVTLALTATLSSLAHAEEKTPLAIVPLAGLGVDAATLEKIDDALVSEAAALKIPVVPAPSVTRGQCNSDVQCLAKLGASLKATRVITGSVGLAGDEVHLKLQVVDVPSATATSKDDVGPLDQAERRVRAAAMWLLDPAAYAESASLLPALSLAGAEVVVDGQVRGNTPLFGPVAVSPGPHDVEVRYAGLKTWKAFVDAPFDEVRRIELVSKDGAIVEVGGASASASSSAPGVTTEKPFPTLLVAGGALGALGAAAAIVAVFAAVSANDSFVKVHDQGDLSAIGANRSAVAVYSVALPVAVVGIGAGAGLIGYLFLE